MEYNSHVWTGALKSILRLHGFAMKKSIKKKNLSFGADVKLQVLPLTYKSNA